MLRQRQTESLPGNEGTQQHLNLLDVPEETSYNLSMIRSYQQYEEAVERVQFLQRLSIDDRIEMEEALELQELMVAVEQYEDQMDAEAVAEYERFERVED